MVKGREGKEKEWDRIEVCIRKGEQEEGDEA